MYIYEHDNTSLRMKAFVGWKEPPWGKGSISSDTDPERYEIKRQFERDAASVEPDNMEQLIGFKNKWDIVHIWFMMVGVPGTLIYRDVSPIYTMGEVDVG